MEGVKAIFDGLWEVSETSEGRSVFWGSILIPLITCGAFCETAAHLEVAKRGILFLLSHQELRCHWRDQREIRSLGAFWRPKSFLLAIWEKREKARTTECGGPFASKWTGTRFHEIWNDCKQFSRCREALTAGCIRLQPLKSFCCLFQARKFLKMNENCSKTNWRSPKTGLFASAGLRTPIKADCATRHYEICLYWHIRETFNQSRPESVRNYAGINKAKVPALLQGAGSSERSMGELKKRFAKPALQ